jgi:hypothetical protein
MNICFAGAEATPPSGTEPAPPNVVSVIRKELCEVIVTLAVLSLLLFLLRFGNRGLS